MPRNVKSASFSRRAGGIPVDIANPHQPLDHALAHRTFWTRLRWVVRSLRDTIPVRIPMRRSETTYRIVCRADPATHQGDHDPDHAHNREPPCSGVGAAGVEATQIAIGISEISIHLT